MNGALIEGGYLAVFFLILWAAVPLWFIYKLARDWRGTLDLMKRDPIGFVLITLMLSGLLAWFGWLLSAGQFFDGKTAAILVVSGLVLSFFPRNKRRK